MNPISNTNLFYSSEGSPELKSALSLVAIVLNAIESGQPKSKAKILQSRSLSLDLPNEINKLLYRLAVDILNSDTKLSDADRLYILNFVIKTSIPSENRDFEVDLSQCPIKLNIQNFPKIIFDLKNNKHLKQISLDCSLMPESVFSHFDQMKNVEHIILTRVQTAHINVITKMTNLTTLKLKDYRLLDENGLQGIDSLKNLKVFVASQGQIKDFDLEPISRLTNLETLILSSCDNLSNNGLRKLYQLTNLQTIRLKFHESMRVAYQALDRIEAQIVLTRTTPTG